VLAHCTCVSGLILAGRCSSLSSPVVLSHSGGTQSCAVLSTWANLLCSHAGSPPPGVLLAHCCSAGSGVMHACMWLAAGEEGWLTHATKCSLASKGVGMVLLTD
jgi:hypothetical protein